MAESLNDMLKHSQAAANDAVEQVRTVALALPRDRATGVSDQMHETTRRLACHESRVEAATLRVSRILHDDLGSLLVAAMMDISWAEQHCGEEPALRDRLRRVRHALSAAVDIKRRLIEDLRPSLLENFGLVTALKWYHEHTCTQASLACSAAYPDDEPCLAPAAATALFRIVQEVLAVSTRHSAATRVHLGLEVGDGELRVRVSHDGEVLTKAQREEADLASLWIVEHRVRALGGTVSVSNPTDGGMRLTADFPLTHITQDAGLAQNA